MRDRSLMLALSLGALMSCSRAEATMDETITAPPSRDSEPALAVLASTAKQTQQLKENDGPHAVHIEAPSPEVVADVLNVPDIPSGTRTALAYQFNAPIYRQPDAKTIGGIARRGARIPIARPIQGSGCSGQWYELQTSGYVCNRLGFNANIDAPDLPPDIATQPPGINQALPFEYAKIDQDETPIYWRIPTKDEEQRQDSTTPLKLRSRGAMFVALDHIEVRDDGVEFARTVRGRYIRNDALVRKPDPTMFGESLDSPSDLPLAFVYVDDATLQTEDGTRALGTAAKFSRFHVLDEIEVDGASLIETEYGWLQREHVRIARKQARPDQIPASDQWIHVSLDEQVLVAYEGDIPVRATLVSTGKAGYEPPFGVFRVVKKYTTKAMSGEDTVDGFYEVDQVPWIMYYWGSLALHGTYWHDGFGNVRSHGCTNIPPADAQWLFRWAAPSLPSRWHGTVDIHGPWVYNTH